MILDIIAIIFIIILSFVLSGVMQNRKMEGSGSNYKYLLSHIILGLSVMVFYKLAKYFKLNQNIDMAHESFTAMDTTASINDFITNNGVGTSIISPNQAQGLTSTELAAYNQKITDLINSLNNAKTQNDTPPSNIVASPDSVQKLDLESQQQYQMFQIDYLNKQIQNAKDIINSQAVANSTTNYKPIKVYSSCVISNANGTTSIDTPIKASSSAASAASSVLPPPGLVSAFANTPQTGYLNGGNLNLAQTTGMFGNLLNGLTTGTSNGPINVNV